MRYDQLRAQAEEADRGTAGRGSPRVAPVADAVAFEQRVALRNAGLIDPRSIFQYVARCRGYSGLAHALAMKPEEVIAEVEAAGLRGRGGKGSPAAPKWRACREADGEEKYAVCNSIDADPRARTARLLMATDPHGVLEGLLIAAYAAGAARCYVCMDTSYTEEAALLAEALAELRRCGLVGDRVLESPFSCEIEVKEMAAGLVSGEETTLIRALEGRQPLPYLSSEKPGAGGLHGRPTLVHAAETLANVSAIFQGHPTAPAAPRGTKIVTLHGASGREQTLEIPLGITLRALIEASEGAPLAALDVKAVQFGGPTGAFFAGELLDTPIAYEALEASGSCLGSGSLIVVAGGSCAVDMAKAAMEVLRDGSCGKCTACREGTLQIAALLDDIADGKAREEDLELLTELARAMANGSICALGRAAGAPLLSSMKLFADDYKAHIEGKACPAKAAR